MPRHRWARNCRQHVAVMQDISHLQERISRTPSNTKVPEAILKEAQALLVTLYRRRDIIATHTVVDALCSYPGFDHEDLSIPDVDPKFILRGLVYATRASKRRPPRRFKLAVYKFWTELKRPPLRRAVLFQALAEEFERDSSGRTMHSFLATSHVRFGRYRTCKLLVLPVAEFYRAQDKADALALWLSRADEAGVPICASSPGRKFLKEADTEPNALDTAQETYTPEDACVMRFRDDIRRPLKKLKKHLDAAQLQTFSGMSEAARARDWQRVLYCYSDSLKSNVTISDACLRLALEAAVELEGIHSATALRLVKQARKESLDVETIMQTLLLARIDGIGDQQAATRSSASVGDAYRLIESLLSAVQPVYPHPSELVYNRAIRVCLQNSEFEQTIKLCMQLGEEHWNGDALFQVHNFASLLTVAVRSKDHALLQKLLEALPGRPYRGHPICKWSLRRARFWLEQMIAKTTSGEEKQKHSDALESLEAAYQNVMQARAQAHWHFKAKLRSIARETLAPKRNYESVETVYKASGPGHAAAIYERSLGEDTNLSLL
ncbi:unnamed protein product [Parascedosporium putredinis]|uniref:Uncharacterized protein n=1 Tax=Parascedosporium putredinis TaxID=1442378 RepID=A0A9P1GU16_9PEZI|nr:unnamed protein product [Parascedosporium putredinis]CAI7987637.1 unnamed protein product [Parascedosporium putredinis]